MSRIGYSLGVLRDNDPLLALRDVVDFDTRVVVANQYRCSRSSPHPVPYRACFGRIIECFARSGDPVLAQLAEEGAARDAQEPSGFCLVSVGSGERFRQLPLLRLVHGVTEILAKGLP